MNVITLKTLREYIDKYAAAREQLLSWYKESEKSSWHTPHDIKNRFKTASFLKKNTVVFNIKGNDFRLVVNIAYKQQALYIKWFGTHQEYDKQSFE